MTLKTGISVCEGHWKCHHSNWCSTVNMDLSRVVSEIFNVDKLHDREIPVNGQPRSLNVVPYDILCMVSY